MKIFVQAKPRARKEGVEKIDQAHFIVAVKEPPVQGRANQTIAQALADHFKIPRSRVILVSGFSSGQKTFEIS